MSDILPGSEDKWIAFCNCGLVKVQTTEPTVEDYTIKCHICNTSDNIRWQFVPKVQ